jgi:class I fructose-bisphosphate aldolase
MPRAVRLPVGESPIEQQNRVLLLAYDQGMEHGPVEFNDETVDPSYVLDIAEHGPFTGIVLQKGVAAAYYQRDKYTVPLVVKLNGRTNLSNHQDPYAPMVCTVDEALDLGAKVVGYSLYLGSKHEAQMMSEFAQVVRDAHERKVRVIVWMSTKNAQVEETHRDMLAYAGRVALELGADYVQLPYGGDVPDYAWVVESAGRCKVLCPGGPYQDKEDTLRLAKSVLQAGAVGMTVGRRVWQAPDPLAVAHMLQTALWKGLS